MRCSIRLILLSLLLCALTSVCLHAQIRLFSTQMQGIYDSVNLASGSVTFFIPVRTKAGKIPFSFQLVGGWYAESYTSGTSSKWESNAYFNGTAFSADFSLAGVPYTTIKSSKPGGCGYTTGYTDFEAIDPTGGTHLLNGYANYTTGCGSTLLSGIATDGSGYTLEVASANPLAYTVYDKFGNAITSSTASGVITTTLTDPDGVTMSSAYNKSTFVTAYTDTLGTNVLNKTPTSVGSPDIYSYVDVNGNTQSFQVNYSLYTLETAFGCSGISEEGPQQAYLPSSISTPTGSSFVISYETTPGHSGSGSYGPYTTGRIAKLTYPMGGYVSYSYSGGNNGINCSSLIVPTLVRTVYDNYSNSSSTWTYVNNNTSSTPGNYAVTATDPAGNQTIYFFAGGYQTQVVYFQGSAPTLFSSASALKAVTTCYNGNFTNCASPSALPTLPISQTDVYTSFNGSSSSLVETKFDAYGNTTEIKQYDFGAATPPTGNPLSDTLIYYGQSWNSSSGSCNTYPSGIYIYGTPCYSYTKNSSGTQVAATQVAYSNSGHPISTARWVGGSSWLTSSTTYNTNGTVASATDADGGVTTYAYNGTGGCNLLPTSVTYPLSSAGSSSQTWNCAGGVVTTSTDANGQVTSYAYNDPLWRLTQVTYPYGGDTFTYNTGSSFPWTIATSNLINSTTSKTTLTSYDGLDRTVLNELTSDPSGTDYTATIYNSLGQVATVSQPYRVGAAVYLQQYTYDALGRLTQILIPNNASKSLTYTNRAVQLQQYSGISNQNTIAQLNGLGQITAVCEVTSQTVMGSTGTPAACGLDIAGAGFLTNYTYDPLGNLTSVVNAANTRTFAYDGLSRLTQVVEPELNSSIGYTYDTQNAGDLYQRVAPAPNQTGTALLTTSYTHDVMHRLTQVNYSDGTTPSVTLAYDQTSNWGQMLSFPKGRLTGRFTCAPGTSCGNTASASTGLTGDVFSYDAMGFVIADFQCTPSLCGASNVWTGYTRDLAGDEVSRSFNGTNIFSHGINAAQQLTSLFSQTLNASVVQNIVYNAAGQPVSDLLGNGIQESWSYDAANNPASYTAGSYSNSASWAGNDLVISASDSINGNWTYGYDNFGRLSSSACSSSSSSNTCSGQSALGYEYVYDQLGNLWVQNLTTGTGYAETHTFNAHNHINDGTAAYDAAGNLTNDSFHTYTYDAEGRLTGVDGGATAVYVYNAAGQRVEWGVGATDNAEYVYDVNGHETAALTPGTTTASTSELFDSMGGRHWLSLNGAAEFLHTDELGTLRAVTNGSGSTVEQCTNAPFGNDLACTASITAYTGLSGTMLDSADSLAHFPARQYTGTQGRWTTPDPAGMAAANPSFPQTWNQYAYAVNNPVSYIDPSGMACYPIERQMTGSCEGFMGNGFMGESWDWFLLMNIPVAGQTQQHVISYDYEWVPSTAVEDFIFVPGTGMIDMNATFVPGYYSYVGQTWGETPIGIGAAAIVNQAQANNGQQTKPQQPQKPPQTVKQKNPPQTVKQKFCYYTSWFPGLVTSAALGAQSLYWGGSLTTLGLAEGAGTLATASAISPALPWIAGGGLALWGARQVICT